MAISASAALWFLPFVLPICFYVAFTDMREMRITNQAVVALAVVFLIVGLIALPLPIYGMRFLQLFGVLIIGILLNAGGAIGAGDAKFAAAATPFIAPGDLRLMLIIFSANLLAAYLT
ncbi:MAG: prepilin peptidase, partial [Marinibacterium sp.]|nr:prepilin peptidase [Marinibacterium sp.]